MAQAAAARTSAPAKAPVAPKSRLAAVKTGKLVRPPRMVIYGPEGVGKSSLAVDAGAIFFNVEDGLGELVATRYPFGDAEDPDDPNVPASLADVYAAIDDLAANEHPYKAVAIDTADALEKLLWRHISERDGFDNIEGYGYGKGYVAAEAEWRVLLKKLDRLRDRGMIVFVLAHAHVRQTKNPDGPDYDRYQLKVHEKAAALLKEWPEVVGFLKFEAGAAPVMGDKAKNPKAKGWASGRRILHVAHAAAFDAKSRLSLEGEIEIGREHPWAPFAEALDQVASTSDDDVKAAIEEQLARLGDHFTSAGGKPSTPETTRGYVKTADRPTLDRILASLRTSEPAATTQQEK